MNVNLYWCRNPANPLTMTPGIAAATKIPTEVEAAAAAILLEETIHSTVVEVEASEIMDPAAAAVALEVATEAVVSEVATEEAVASEAATEVVALETATKEAEEATGLAMMMTTHPAEASAALAVATETKAIATEDIEEAGEVEVDQASTVITAAEVCMRI
jgi:hypothetical protein